MSGILSARASWRVAATFVGVLSVAGCTGDDPPAEPTASATTEEVPTADAGPVWSLEELTDAVVSQDEEVIASIEGELAYQEEPVRARFDVLAVDAGDAATVVRLRMTTLGDGESVQTLDAYLSPDRSLAHDIRGIALQVPAQSTRLQPTLVAPNSDSDGTLGCLCSALPGSVDPAKPFLFTATFPPLDPATKTVDLELVGFPLVTGIPVDHS